MTKIVGYLSWLKIPVYPLLLLLIIIVIIIIITVIIIIIIIINWEKLRCERVCCGSDVLNLFYSIRLLKLILYDWIPLNKGRLELTKKLLILSFGYSIGFINKKCCRSYLWIL